MKKIIVVSLVSLFVAIANIVSASVPCAGLYPSPNCPKIKPGCTHINKLIYLETKSKIDLLQARHSHSEHWASGFAQYEFFNHIEDESYKMSPSTVKILQELDLLNDHGNVKQSIRQAYMQCEYKSNY